MKTKTYISPLFIFIVFLILKLTNTVQWDWWIITSPLWIVPVAIIGFAIGLILFIITSIIVGTTLDNIFENIKSKFSKFKK